MGIRARLALAGAATLVVGFAVAQLTGARWLGGLVLIVGAVVIGMLGWRFAGPLRTIASIAVFLVAFVLSHPLGRVIGAWPSVLVVSVLAGVLAFALLRPAAASRGQLTA